MNALRRFCTVINPCPAARSKQRGLSLIELMVALALGLIIVAALVQLFVNISRTNQEMAKTNSQIENARFAMQFLQNDIVHAGYWGGYIPDFDDLSVDGIPAHAPAAKPDPVCQAFTTAAWSPAYQDALLGIPVEVYSTMPNGCGAVVTDRLPGTDLLVVRHVATCAAGEAGCEALNTDKLYMQVSNCIDDTERYALDPNAVPLLELDCETANPAAKRKFVQNIYYIRDHANSVGDGIPTLMRSEFDLSPGGALEQQAPVALVEGIEAFRVELGIDRFGQAGDPVDYEKAIDWPDDKNRFTAPNRGDGVPEGGFERCLSEDAGCAVLADLANVVAVKLYLLARANTVTAGYTDTKTYELGSSGTIGPFSDGFKRHVFQSTIRLNNIAGRRETPDPNTVVTP